MAYLSFAGLCFATLAGILGRRSHAIALFSVMMALFCLPNVSRGGASPSLAAAAYVVFAVCLAVALSGLSMETLRTHRAVILSWLGAFSSLGLLGLAMWVDQRVLVISALALVVVAFIVMATVTVRWFREGHANDVSLGE